MDYVKQTVLGKFYEKFNISSGIKLKMHSMQFK